jgi:regulator of PEP synthase PpsR (kinase-PPPase family)
MNNKFDLYLVSDSTGETLDRIAVAIKAQFEDVDLSVHHFSFIRTKDQINALIKRCKKDKNPIVLYTLVEQEAVSYLKDTALIEKITCLGVLDHLVLKFENILNKKANHVPSGQHVLNKDYYEKISSMHFTIEHDDGQKLETINEADIIIFGVSRTSKTPTSIYLANRGYKVANIPLTGTENIDSYLIDFKRKTVVGFVIDPYRLEDVRRTRLSLITEDRHTNYINIESIQKEVEDSKKLFSLKSIPIIDVTRRSVEETSASIIKIHEIKHNL